MWSCVDSIWFIRHHRCVLSQIAWICVSLELVAFFFCVKHIDLISKNDKSTVGSLESDIAVAEIHGDLAIFPTLVNRRRKRFEFWIFASWIFASFTRQINATHRVLMYPRIWLVASTTTTRWAAFGAVKFPFLFPDSFDSLFVSIATSAVYFRSFCVCVVVTCRYSCSFLVALPVSPLTPSLAHSCICNMLQRAPSGWHYSFNLWLIKYVYVALGGRRTKLWYSIAWVCVCVCLLALRCVWRCVFCTQRVFSIRLFFVLIRPSMLQVYLDHFYVRCALARSTHRVIAFLLVLFELWSIFSSFLSLFLRSVSPVSVSLCLSSLPFFLHGCYSFCRFHIARCERSIDLSIDCRIRSRLCCCRGRSKSAICPNRLSSSCWCVGSLLIWAWGVCLALVPEALIVTLMLNCRMVDCLVVVVVGCCAVWIPPVVALQCYPRPSPPTDTVLFK